MISIRTSRAPRHAATRSLLMILVVLGMFIGCGGAEPQGATTQSVAGETQQTLMSRWNAVAQGVTTSDGFDFLWNAYDKFPHPTFKGGSAEAYQKFATILIAFYQSGDNFDFLTKNELFRVTLSSTLVNGNPGVDTTFEQITTLLSSDPPVSADDQQTLATYAAKIKALP
jgi:hypothetical protein